MSCITTVDQCIECNTGYEKKGWKCVSNKTIEFSIAFETDGPKKFKSSDEEIRNGLLQAFAEAQNLN